MLPFGREGETPEHSLIPFLVAEFDRQGHGLNGSVNQLLSIFKSILANKRTSFLIDRPFSMPLRGLTTD